MSSLLTRAEFVAFLRAQPADRMFYRRWQPRCPIASALREQHHAVAVRVTRWRLHLWKDEHAKEIVERAPRWVDRFIAQWDSRLTTSAGTAAEALRLLGEGE